PRLVSALLVLTRDRHGLLRALLSVVEPMIEGTRLAEPRDLHGLSDAHGTYRGIRCGDLIQELPGLGETRRKRVSVSEPGERRPRLELPLPAQREPALERRDGAVEGALHGKHAPEGG